MELLKGYIDHFIYRNEENGYAVVNFICDGHEQTLVGTFPDAGIGDILEAEGEYVDHNVYGNQFKVSAYRICMPTDAVSVERYLSSGAIKGIGATLASRIVKAFGDDAFRIMEEEPERLAEVKGISENKAREIATQMAEKRELRSALLFLQRYGITGALAIRLYEFYGSRLYAVLRENPYLLAEEVNGVGFKTADEIARKMGIEADSAYRVGSGILYALQEASADGHCYLPERQLREATQKLLELDDASMDVLFDAQMEALCMEHKLTRKGENAVYATSFYRAELAVASMLYDLQHAFAPAEEDDIDSLEKEILTLEAVMGISLDDLQREAVIKSIVNGVFLLSGGPGTGKTTTINAIIRYFTRKGKDVLLAAPTGRAAKRMTEATGYEAKTIHRLLEANGLTYERGAENPIEADVVIIDEMSMVDLWLFKALLNAVVSGMHLVIVGDAAQLPSVGPGQVLRDLIASGAFETVILKTIFRQAEGSDIVLNAHRIHRGEEITMDNKSKDFFVLHRQSADVICKHLVQLIRDKLPPYVEADASEIQVLTPMKRGALGVHALNRVLQEHLNPPHPSRAEYAPDENRLFREGDKVMQTKNNYQAEWEVLGGFNIPIAHGTGIFNGDMGIVDRIDHGARQVTVIFDEGRRIRYPFSALDELEIAYAVTIHKSQGSEYPAVILPLLGGPKMLFNRNLLYTAVTRARKCVVILGEPDVVRQMIDNEEQMLRYTGLKERIEEVVRARE